MVGPGTGDGAVLVVFLDFAAFFFAALVVTGAADTVGAALPVGWFVGLPVLDFFVFSFSTRRSSVIIVSFCAATATAVLVLHDAKGDSPKASSSSAVDSS